jgi:hypothetical protein
MWWNIIIAINCDRCHNNQSTGKINLKMLLYKCILWLSNKLYSYHTVSWMHPVLFLFATTKILQVHVWIRFYSNRQYSVDSRAILMRLLPYILYDHIYLFLTWSRTLELLEKFCSQHSNHQYSVDSRVVLVKLSLYTP